MKKNDDILDSASETASRLYRSAMKLFRSLRVMRPENGLSITKLSVLARLHQDGVSTASALAAYLRIQPQSITRLIADLEKQGLISRRPDAADRRQSLIDITDQGLRTLNEEVQDQQTHLASLLNRALTPAELGILALAGDLMDRLARDVDAQREGRSDN